MTVAHVIGWHIDVAQHPTAGHPYIPRVALPPARTSTPIELGCELLGILLSEVGDDDIGPRAAKTKQQFLDGA